MVGAQSTLGSARQLVPLVKWRVKARIRRNWNGRSILNSDRVLRGFGFGRPILGVRLDWGSHKKRKERIAAPVQGDGADGSGLERRWTSARRLVPLVKWRVNARIRRN
jgi:hypothetical protein